MAYFRASVIAASLLPLPPMSVLTAVRAQQIVSPPYLGVWLREEHDRHIRIAPCDGAVGPICGRIVRLLDPKTGGALPDQTVRGKNGKPLVGTPVLLGCEATGADLRCATAYIPTSDHSVPNVTLTPDGHDGMKVGRFPRFFHWTRVIK